MCFFDSAACLRDGWLVNDDDIGPQAWSFWDADHSGFLEFQAQT